LAEYLDAITIVWGLYLLIHLSIIDLSREGVVAILSVALYLIAQSGWTAAWLAGSVWGAHFNNYIWFMFNSSVMLLVTLIALGRKDEDR